MDAPSRVASGELRRSTGSSSKPRPNLSSAWRRRTPGGETARGSSLGHPGARPLALLTCAHTGAMPRGGWEEGEMVAAELNALGL